MIRWSPSLFAAKSRNLFTRRPIRRRLGLMKLESRTVPATITVTNNLDTVAVDGSVSLREALNSINLGADINADVVGVGAYGTSDSINFSGVVSPIGLPAGQLTVGKAVTVTGPGSGSLTVQNTAAAAATSNVFNVTNAAGLVSITGLTITGGNLTVNNGGGITMTAAGNLTLTDVVVTGNKSAVEGGGISNQSTGILTLTNCTVSLNSCTGGDGGGINNQSTGQVVLTNSTMSGNTASSDGGAIYMNNGGAMTLNGSIITGNTATATSGGIYVFGSAGVWQITNSTLTLNQAKGGVGGGIRVNSGALTVTNSSITSNTASTTGGGINQSGGTITLNGSFVGSNTATTNGGGINSSATININGSTINGNTANTQGGGLNTSGTVNVNAPAGTAGSTISSNTSPLGGGWSITGGTVTLRNSTVAKNSATGTSGGGGLNITGGTVNIQNTTVALNQANGAGAVGGGIRRTAGTLNLSSALIADNTSTAGGPDGHSTAAATITLNNSLIGVDNAADNLTYTGTGQTNVASGLDPAGLQLNGAPAGTPLSIALVGGSLALDTGNNTFALTTDQRGAGFPRQQGAGADVGAFELASPIPSASGGPYAPITAVVADYTFTVTYTDNDSNIDLTSLDNGDITVSGPAFTTGAVFVSSTPADKSVTATYKVTPTSAPFDAAENGTYTISVNAGQVFDTDGVPKSVPAGNVGTFKVSLVTTFVVNAINDEAVDSDGKMSLREALNAANADDSTADTVTFDGTVFSGPQTITLALGQLSITGAVQVTGPAAGVTVDAGGLSRILNVDVVGKSTQAISLSNMTLTNGNSGAANGGGILNNDEALALTGVTVKNSTTTLDGGGIAVTSATGSLSLTNCTINGNSATGATYSNGGGVFLSAGSAVTISNSTVSNNSSGEDGGGIYFFSGGSLSMTNSTVSGNNSNTKSSSVGGGGIYLFNTTTTITQSTVSGNSTNSGGKDNNGGGIAALSTSKVSIVNSTVAFNNAGTKSGGGIHNSGSATITLDSTIVSDNSAATGKDVNGAVTANFSLISSSAGATITGASNILDVSAGLQPLALNGGTTANHLPTLNVFNKGNNSLSLTLDQRGGPRVLEGSIDIGSVESIAPASTPPTAVATAPNITVAGGTANTITVVYTDAETNINVSKLGNGDLEVTGPGGPYTVVFKTSTPVDKSVTATYEVSAPGGTFDAADNGTYTINVVAGEVFDTDAVPQSVPAGAIGSYNVSLASNYVVNATNDEAVDTDGKISLREAILAANADASTADTVSFDVGVFGTPQTILFGLGEMKITGPVDIQGPSVGVKVDAGGASRHLNITGTGTTAVSISDMTLTNGSVLGDGGSVIASGAALTFLRMALTNNSGDEGGALALSSGSLSATDSTFSGNYAYYGGGAIYNTGGTGVTLTRTTVSGNSANASGGGILLSGSQTVNIVNSTISGNTTKLNGGGLRAYGSFTGTLNVQNSTVTNNKIIGAGAGSGLSRNGGTFNVVSSIVAQNSGGSTGDLSGIQNVNYSLIGATDGATITGANNITGTLATPADAKLGPLQNNGGPTETHLPGGGSPAFNNGSNPLALTVDQRGLPRTLGGVVDIGSVESTPPVSSPPTAKATAPDVTLPGGTVNTITVVYTDAETNIDISKLDNNDLEVTGPGGPYSVVFKSSTGAAKSVTATYEVTAPGGTFDAADNGPYTINVKAGEVFDTDVPPQSVAASAAGSYKVAIGQLFVVNATNDESVDSDGKVSLREALEASNAAAGIADSVTFDPTVFATAQTIALALGELVVTDAVFITGPTAVLAIDAGGLSRVMNTAGAPAGTAISISNLTLTNGNQTGTTFADVGGGLRIDDEVVSLTNVRVTNSKAVIEGGGIGISAAAGKLTLTNSTVSGNQSTGATGLHNGAGGGIGMRAASSVTIVNSTIANNIAARNGGGVYFYFSGSLSVTASTISGNKALTPGTIGGGGIYFYGTATTFSILNSTISGNSADNGAGAGYGGGIVTNAFAGPFTIQNSTIAFNNAGKGGGGLFSTGTAATFNSTIVAKNTVALANAPTADVGFFAAIVVAGDNNLIGIQDAGTKATFGAATLTGSVATPLDPLLEPLGDYSGPTLTHALKIGSPAIDKGNNVAGLANDQRGAPWERIDGAAIDIGAFELGQMITDDGVQINDGSAQRSIIRSIVLTFRLPVDFPAGIGAAFTLERKSSTPTGEQPGVLGLVNINPVQTAPDQVTITFLTSGPNPVNASNAGSLSLPDGGYELTIIANNVTGNGPLNHGKNFHKGFHRLFGDANGDGVVGSADFAEFRKTFGIFDPVLGPIFDFFHNLGTPPIGSNEFTEFRKRFGLSIP